MSWELSMQEEKELDEGTAADSYIYPRHWHILANIWPADTRMPPVSKIESC